MDCVAERLRGLEAGMLEGWSLGVMGGCEADMLESWGAGKLEVGELGDWYPGGAGRWGS